MYALAEIAHLAVLVYMHMYTHAQAHARAHAYGLLVDLLVEAQLVLLFRSRVRTLPMLARRHGGSTRTNGRRGRAKIDISSNIDLGPEAVSLRQRGGGRDKRADQQGQGG